MNPTIVELFERTIAELGAKSERSTSNPTVRLGTQDLHVILGVTDSAGEVSWIELDTKAVIHEGTDRPRGVVVTQLHTIPEVLSDYVAASYEEQRLRRITAAVPGVVYQYLLRADGSGKFTFISEGVAELTDISAQQVQANPDRIWDLVPLEVAQQIRAEMQKVSQNPQPWNWEQKVVTPAGREKWIRAQAIPDPTDAEGNTLWNGIMLDVTERRAAEELARQRQEELAHALRLISMGEIAAELAHQLNQPLASIVNFINGLLRQRRGGNFELDNLDPILQEIATQALEAGRILRRIRDLSRKLPEQREDIDLNAIVNRAITYLEPEFQRNAIEQHSELAQALPLVCVNAVEIEQVILNLLRNAVESIRDSNPPQRRIVVHTRSTPEGMAELAITDSGPGVDDDTASRFFEPFFTTKPQSAGMGLAIARSVIEAHLGQLRFSRDAAGSPSIVVTLPLATKTSQA